MPGPGGWHIQSGRSPETPDSTPRESRALESREAKQRLLSFSSVDPFPESPSSSPGEPDHTSPEVFPPLKDETLSDPSPIKSETPEPSVEQATNDTPSEKECVPPEPEVSQTQHQEHERETLECDVVLAHSVVNEPVWESSAGKSSPARAVLHPAVVDNSSPKPTMVQSPPRRRTVANKPRLRELCNTPVVKSQFSEPISGSYDLQAWGKHRVPHNKLAHQRGFASAIVGSLCGNARKSTFQQEHETVETHADAVDRVLSQAAHARARTRVRERVLTPALISRRSSTSRQIPRARTAAFGCSRTPSPSWEMQQRVEQQEQPSVPSLVAGAQQPVLYRCHGRFSTPLVQRHRGIRMLRRIPPPLGTSTHSQFYGSLFQLSS